MGTISHYVHDLRRTWSVASKLLSPSLFLKQKLMDFGIPGSTIAHMPIFVDFSEHPVSDNCNFDYVLYFGRLADNKGIKTLLDAVRGLDCKLLLIGEGPLSGWVDDVCASSHGRISRLPFVSSRDELRTYIQHAAFTVVPSVWYENQPATILETYAMGRPVIGSDIGGIPELIEHERTGLLCAAGNSAELADRVKFMWERPTLCREWGTNGNRKLREGFSRKCHYERLIQTYRSLCNPEVSQTLLTGAVS
jgi:glycosyltransferase involved in cell wall biosynthesis